MKQRTAIVIGGGLAGLAAADALAGRGVAVTLLESRAVLGGRASSFTDRETGASLDNCQHVAMGCCTNYLHFCRSLGVASSLKKLDRLNFIDSAGRLSEFRPSRWLPAPLHLLPGLSRLKFLSARDRRDIATGLKLLVRFRETALKQAFSPEFLKEIGQTQEGLERRLQEQRNDWPFDRFLQTAGQGPSVCEKFWKVVLVSALSEEPENIALQYAAKVFVEGFLANKRGWEVYVPTVPLDDLYGEALFARMRERGSEIRLSAGVRELIDDADGNIRSAVLRDGTELQADDYIVALPWHRFGEVLPPSLQLKYRECGEMKPVPISSVHLWFDRPITELDHAIFVERLSQWLFRREARSAGERAPQHTGHYYQVVISASRVPAAMKQQEVIDTVCDELRDVFAAARGNNLLHARVVTEHKAVFSPRPGVERLRPSQETMIDNLFLAGDWTDTGWPATMEGAVRSGYLAAEGILDRAGTPATILQPDLPVARLSRWLFGL